MRNLAFYEGEDLSPLLIKSEKSRSSIEALFFKIQEQAMNCLAPGSSSAMKRCAYSYSTCNIPPA